MFNAVINFLFIFLICSKKSLSRNKKFYFRTVGQFQFNVNLLNYYMPVCNGVGKKMMERTISKVKEKYYNTFCPPIPFNYVL